MLKLLIASCLVAVALGDGPRRDCCTPGDKTAVQEQWNRLWNSQDSGRIKTILGGVIFEELFKLDPSTKDLFKRVNVDDTSSPEFQAHTVRVLNGLDIIINLLQDEAATAAALAHLGEQHVARDGVRAAYFEEMGKVLLNGLDNLIPNFAYDSWKSCFNRVAKGITDKLPA